MNPNPNDAGVIQVLLDRFNNQRLPRALEMKAKVDAGGKLDPSEVDYLTDILSDIHELRGLIERNPEYQELVVKGISLYTEITERALANEQAR